MKAFAYKTVSITMALLLLVSTTSWKVEKHFCMGHLVDISFFSSAEDCGMEMDLTRNDESKPTAKQESSCCNNEVSFVSGQDDLKLSFSDFDFEHQLFLVAFTKSYIDLFTGLKEQIVPHKNYPPPSLVKDIQVLDQVFLI